MIDAVARNVPTAASLMSYNYLVAASVTCYLSCRRTLEISVVEVDGEYLQWLFIILIL